MSRALIILAAVLLSGGCAARRATAPAAAQPPAAPEDDAVAAALVFQAPITLGQPPLNLDRDARAASAFLGYEELQTHFYYLRTIDRQLDGEREQYDRTAVSEKVGISYR